MSYLDVPRIHLSGQFFTDPSTVNNDPQHYEPDCTNPSPWQAPKGQHRFQLSNCTIKSVMGHDGPLDDDPLVGLSIVTTDKPSPAKIVDLDVYQQGVSTIYGMQLQLAVSDTLVLTGNVDPATLNLFWFNAVLPTRSWQDGDYVQDSFGGDMNACGLFQTVVRFDPANWPDTSSPILTALKAETVSENGQLLLSFKFVLDGYRNVPQDTSYQYGRITGSLGPVKLNEPRYNAGQRWLQPRPFSNKSPWNSPSFMSCPFNVDKVRKKLVIDLANSLCRQSAGGPPVELGTLTAVVTTPLSPVTQSLGEVDYQAFGYDDHAHITELDLTDDQVDRLNNGKLSLVMSRTDIGPQAVLTEAASDVDFAVEIRPIRMMGDVGTVATTQVYVSRRGMPLCGKQLGIYVESVEGKTPGATVPPTNPGNSPNAEEAIVATISPSDALGFATVTITICKDPGQRTPELDGQLYFILVYDPDLPRPDWSKEAPQQDHQISCIAWSQYAVNTNPPWEEVSRLLAPYMKLYPAMKEQMDLTDLKTFTLFSDNPPWDKVYSEPPYKNGSLEISAGGIPFYLTRNFTDPRYMPVTRDLSPNKVLTILHFIKNLQQAAPN